MTFILRILAFLDGENWNKLHGNGVNWFANWHNIVSKAMKLIPLVYKRNQTYVLT